MRPDDAQVYHAEQIGSLAGADVISALTLTYADEAVGIARAAQDAGLPAIVSFTVETDGRLPDETPLGEAVEAVDAATGGAPEAFMVNCAHPTHFASALEGGWTERIRGVRANASRLSHAELDASDELDAGDPAELAARYVELRERLPALSILGGCCGTDARHVGAIVSAWRA
jgi:S-methylmethionine-dependent homocysteine/selenocysteine methylase